MYRRSVVVVQFGKWRTRGIVIREKYIDMVLTFFQVRTKTEHYHNSAVFSGSLPENAQCLVQWFEQQWSGEIILYCSYNSLAWACTQRDNLANTSNVVSCVLFSPCGVFVSHCSLICYYC